MAGNFLSSLFFFMGSFSGSVATIVNFLEPYLSAFITRSYRYGKYSANVHQPVVEKLEVPKRWFKHFYAYCGPTSCIVLFFVYNKYLWNGNVPEIIHWLLNILMGNARKALVSPECTLLATTLFTIHCCKRLYESHCVSIFSNNNMNITHYMVGFIHYTGLLACLIGESKGFVKGSEEVFSWEKITFFQILCAVIFLLSSYAQLQANYILRDLRRQKDGKVVHATYKIPYGGLFEYVSGALQLTEILIYVSVSLILWQSSTYHWVTYWVVINQTETAIFTHKWYHKTFKDYPKTRKVLIPYVY